MKLNTHNRTPKPKDSKLVKGLLILCSILIYSLFILFSFVCIFYAQSFTGGIFVMMIPILMTAIIFIPIKDMEKAHIEIKENEIYVIDYYWGIKAEKHILLSDITHTEICSGYSLKVKGYRFNFTGMRYIVFMHNKKYLFKIIDTPETEKIFKQYIR